MIDRFELGIYRHEQSGHIVLFCSQSLMSRELIARCDRKVAMISNYIVIISASLLAVFYHCMKNGSLESNFVI